MNTLLHICAAEELAPGTRRVVEIDAYEEILVLNVAGTVYAISNVCPHEGAALQRGQVEGTVLYCPLHRWGFELSSGRCVDDATLCGRTYRVETKDAQLFLYLR
jgi:nitrite reductase/ring-hydroxylating ferredoxin subunit